MRIIAFFYQHMLDVGVVDIIIDYINNYVFYNRWYYNNTYYYTFYKLSVIVKYVRYINVY